MPEPSRLREIASWYRAFAEQAGNLVIWDVRLSAAEELEVEADRMETERSEISRDYHLRFPGDRSDH